MATQATPILPPALRAGDTIAFVTPSSRITHLFPTRVPRAQAFLESLGFPVKQIFTDTTSLSHSASVLARCAEIHTAFADPSVRAIVCTIGGLSCNELLPHLDYALIAANPKIFIGFSDITLLHHAFYTQCHLRTFYGPSVMSQFANYPVPHAFSLDHFLHVLRDTVDVPVGPLPRSTEWTQEFNDWTQEIHNPRARTMVPNPGWKWLQHGVAQGVLYGGCVPSILQLAGTKYWPDYEGTILLLEMPDWDAPDKGMPLEFFRSYMADLANVGVLGRVKGVVMGRPFHYDEETEKEWEQILMEQCEVAGMEGPVVVGVDVGHTDPILTMPLGAEVRVDAGRDEIVVLEAAVAKWE